MDIVKSIKRGMIEIGCDQNGLAKKLGISSAYASRICRGEMEVKSGTIKHLADTFGVTASVFISWGEE
jgi:transcriptional regulator with XRE-family HTH domain